ncbi:hypothetical protein AAKU52_003063 [Pedobacter sp. CG_S7]|uniref:DUF4856 domain-containing protein n=1 Tax=Pedobacter sp. CG_S7 TaxID=3143930 RepID=UPI00339A66C6
MKNLFTLCAITLLIGFASCKKEDDNTIQLRTKVDASVYTDATPYASTFVDAKSTSTVDFSAGNAKLNMFKGLNTYINLNKTQLITADASKNLYSNTGNPFTIDYSTEFATLNSASFGLKNFTASSLSATNATTVRQKIEADLTSNGAISPFFGVTASSGIAGKLGTYMVDAKGIEVAQVIQKGLIGAFQIDYIGNVLLKDRLNADNSTVVSGKNYTSLEHNWDEAYATLTLNPIIYAGYTNSTNSRTESFLASYIWEYNQSNYANIYLAFLKGRAAIVNNDRNELNKQALFIRTQFEVAIANAALGYLGKWTSGTTDAARAHAIGEGAGFIYSLRFCTVNNVDAKFSDDVLTALLGSNNGFWDLTQAKINTASASIKAKFNIN